MAEKEEKEEKGMLIGASEALNKGFKSAGGLLSRGF